MKNEALSPVSGHLYFFRRKQTFMVLNRAILIIIGQQDKNLKPNLLFFWQKWGSTTRKICSEYVQLVTRQFWSCREVHLPEKICGMDPD